MSIRECLKKTCVKFRYFPKHQEEPADCSKVKFLGSQRSPCFR
jgi:hypothetical protein